MKKKFSIIFIIIGIILISNMVFASYKEVIRGEATGKMKIPIFIFNSENLVQGKMSSINNNFYENTFDILNYIEGKNVVNEIDFEYTIKVIPSTTNFPVKYRLVNLETNMELALDSSLESPKISLGTSKEKHMYKLIAEWDMENTTQELEENLEVEIQIKGVQNK